MLTQGMSMGQNFAKTEAGVKFVSKLLAIAGGHAGSAQAAEIQPPSSPQIQAPSVGK